MNGSMMIYLSEIYIRLSRIRYNLGLALGLGLTPQSRKAWQRTQIAASLLR